MPAQATTATESKQPTTTQPTYQPQSQPPQQSTYLLPTLRSAFTKALRSTLSKASYPSFASCYPTPAARKPETLQTIHAQIVGKIQSKAAGEFEAVVRERDLDARLAEWEDVIKSARERREMSGAGHGSGNGDGSGNGAKSIHTLPPEELLRATMAGELGLLAKGLETRLETQRRENEGLVEELLRRRAEIERLVARLEGVVGDMQGANGVLDGAAREVDG